MRRLLPHRFCVDGGGSLLAASVTGTPVVLADVVGSAMRIPEPAQAPEDLAPVRG